MGDTGGCICITTRRGNTCAGTRVLVTDQHNSSQCRWKREREVAAGKMGAEMLLSTRRHQWEPTQRCQQPSMPPTAPAPTSISCVLCLCAWRVAERHASARARRGPRDHQRTTYHTSSPCLRARSRIIFHLLFPPCTDGQGTARRPQVASKAGKGARTPETTGRRGG